MSDLSPSDIKVGDIFYECEAGMNIEAKVTVAPIVSNEFEGRKQWSWKAENTQNGDTIDYLITEGLEHYGPRLYRQPQYCRVSNGEISFPLLGGSDV